jgi:predicted ATPase
LTANAVGALERDERRRPYPDTLRRLAAALGLTEAERAELVAALAAKRAAGAAAPSRDDWGVPPRLPGYLDSLVGRERETDVTLQLLLRPEVRLLTLTGPGGIGKTRLAVELATRAAAHFGDGVFFVPLAPVARADQVASAIVQVVGAREAAGRGPLPTLVAALCDRRALLVLDNFEHVAEAAPSITALLLDCPQLKVLATSRVALRVRGEQEYRVPPLELPNAQAAALTADLTQVPAVRLFVDRARAVAPDFELAPEHAAAVAAICRRLDGLPLAIELAAARSALLPPPALLERLERRLDVLAGGPRDLPARQRTMRAAIAWSYDLLGPGEQALFRQLSVFAGGATLAAVEAICATEPGTASVLERLGTLLDSSLVYREPSNRAGTPRIAMLETIRAFAAECLDDADGHAELAHRHAAYYYALALEGGSQLMGAEQIVWLDRLHHERHNLHAALRCFMDDRDGDAAVQMTWALWRYWWVRGLQRDARRWMEEVLARAAADVPLAPAGRAHALLVVGSMAWSEGDHAPAVAALEAGVALCRQTDDMRGQAIGLMMLGLALLGANPPGTARAHTSFEESLRLFEMAGEPWGQAFALGYLGLIPLRAGAYASARRCFAASLDVARTAGDRVSIHQALYNLGLAAQAQGEHGVAEEYFAEGLQLALELGDVVNAGYFLKGLGQSAGVRGRHALAVLLLSAAATALEATGSPPDRYVQNHQLDEQVQAAARVALDDTGFETAWQRGRSLALEAVAAEALALVGGEQDGNRRSYAG